MVDASISKNQRRNFRNWIGSLSFSVPKTIEKTPNVNVLLKKLYYLMRIRNFKTDEKFRKFELYGCSLNPMEN